LLLNVFCLVLILVWPRYSRHLRGGASVRGGGVVFAIRSNSLALT